MIYRARNTCTSSRTYRKEGGILTLKEEEELAEKAKLSYIHARSCTLSTLTCITYAFIYILYRSHGSFEMIQGQKYMDKLASLHGKEADVLTLKEEEELAQKAKETDRELWSVQVFRSIDTHSAYFHEARLLPGVWSASLSLWVCVCARGMPCLHTFQSIA